MVNRPYLSVVVPTRDRPDQVARALKAILSSTFSDFEVLVVDQSRDDLTAARVHRQLANGVPVRLLRDTGTGSSHARNVGIAASKGEIIAFTDDDCEAAPDWLELLAAAFRADADAGAACGAVMTAPHNMDEGFIVGYRPQQRRRLTGRLAKLQDAGIGANMAFRREALDAVGGWDELLGAGSRFEGAGDRDLVYRVLSAGYALLELPEASVTHRGFRNWQAGRELMRGRFRGIGAAYGKHVWLGDPVAGLLLLHELWMALDNIGRCLVSATRPLGLGRLMGLLSGFFSSFGQPVDASTKRYKLPDQGPDAIRRTPLAPNPETCPDRRVG